MRSSLPEEKRPTVDDTELACVILSSGQPVEKACKMLDVTRRQFRFWIERSEDFRKSIELARESGVDAIIEQCMIIADDESKDKFQDGDIVRHNPIAVNRARLRIETRLKIAKYLAPMKFAEARDLVRLKEMAEEREDREREKREKDNPINISDRLKAARERIASRVSDAQIVTDISKHKADK